MRLASLRLASLLAALLLALSPLLPGQAYSTSGPADHVALADFDRDGFPDMAVVTEEPAVDVFFNDHHGGFGNFTRYSVPSTGPALAADINGDGWPDVLIARGSGSAKTLLLNNRDGTFRTGTAPTTQLPVFSFAAGDFNRDGKVDLAAFEGKQIEILINQGSGTFAPIQILKMSGSSASGVVGDFDGDGFADIANSEGNKALVWWGKGNGAFAAPAIITPPSTDGFATLTAADFNNDGTLEDLAISSDHPDPNCPPENAPFCGSETAHIYKNLGGRKFSLISSFSMGPAASGVLFTADLNSDLNQDVVNLFNAAGVFSGELSFRPGHGNNTFGAEQVIDNPSAIEVGFRDLNLDSRTDVIIPRNFPDGEVDVTLATTGPRNCPGVNSGVLRAKFCAPLDGATVTSPFLVTAAGNSPIGVQRLEIWVDGKKVSQKLGDQVNKRISLSPGQHRLVVVAVDKYVGHASAVEHVNVQ
jgi:hypothetical protein